MNGFVVQQREADKCFCVFLKSLVCVLMILNYFGMSCDGMRAQQDHFMGKKDGKWLLC